LESPETPKRLSRRAVFLDRDGVLNRAPVREGKPYPPASLAELEISPNTAELLERLRAHGFLLIVVTNQPDVARGRLTRAAVEAIHNALAHALPLDEIRVCYHDDAAHCACRKPKPGMLLDAAREHGIDLAASYLIGDRWRDVEAGQNVGCKAVFIDYQYAERLPSGEYITVLSLEEAIDWICDRETRP
jgi:D-glycero-D-manno-heptose 1,7-bisphosphate phosphatase